jgi:DNA end-binding protein Ku
MPRAIWSGSIGFGLVNVPVKLFSAVEEKGIHFHQFQEGTQSRVRNKRVNEKSGKEVPYEKVVKGYETSKGKYVMLTPEELESVEPGKTRTIDIEDFVDLDEVDPIFFDTTYYVAPADDASKRPYALLLDAMERANKVAIGRFVMRTKQYLACIRPMDGVLALETMHFADEVRNAKDLDNVPGRLKLTDKERRVAKQLLDSLASEWEPDKYEDTYRTAVLQLIKRKGKGEEIELERPEPDEGRVVDLMAALEASVKEARDKRTTKRAGATRRKKAS